MRSSAARLLVNLACRSAVEAATADIRTARYRAARFITDQSRLLINTTRRMGGSQPELGSTVSRYDAAASELRNWYLVVARATLDRHFSSLGGPIASGVPGAAEVEETAAVISRIRPQDDPIRPFRATAVVWRAAEADVDTFIAEAYAQLVGDAVVKAGAYVDQPSVQNAVSDGTQNSENGISDSEVRMAILRHWFQRCYLAEVDAAFGLLEPLQTVTRGEAVEVARCVERVEFRRLIGTDGIPLVTAQGTALTQDDRRLDAGEVGIVPPPRAQERRPRSRHLRQAVTMGWAAGSAQYRAAWARAASVSGDPTESRWTEIPGPDQSKLIASWLTTHRDQFRHPPPDVDCTDPQLPVCFMGELLCGPSETAAAAMFNHVGDLERRRETRDEPSVDQALVGRVGKTTARLVTLRAELQSLAAVRTEPPTPPWSRMETSSAAVIDQTPSTRSTAAQSI